MLTFILSFTFHTGELKKPAGPESFFRHKNNILSGNAGLNFFLYVRWKRVAIWAEQAQTQISNISRHMSHANWAIFLNLLRLVWFGGCWDTCPRVFTLVPQLSTTYLLHMYTPQTSRQRYGPHTSFYFSIIKKDNNDCPNKYFFTAVSRMELGPINIISNNHILQYCSTYMTNLAELFSCSLYVFATAPFSITNAYSSLGRYGLF